MAHIMKVLAAANSKRNSKRFLIWLVVVAWSAAMQLWLQEVVPPEAKWRIMPMALLFLNMVSEDYFRQTVDVRKIAVLVLLIFHISPQPLQLLLLRWASGFGVFLAFYAGALHYIPKGKVPKECSPFQETPFALAFLPSFAIAFFADALFHLCGYTIDTSLLPELNACLLLAWAFMPRACCMGVAVLLGWFLFHWLRYLRHKAENYGTVEGIGFGDVLFLPIFVAFFGWAEFSIVYTASLLIHLLRYGFLHCFARKGEDRVCP